MAQNALPEEQRIYTLKITLCGSDPPIWRRFQIEGGATLGELHETLQAVMGWENCHLHEFKAGQRSFTGFRPGMDMDFMDDFEDEDECLVFEVLARKRSKLKYIYDFGDDWHHDVVVEQITAPEPGVRYPVCLDGAGACPPEDSGGIGGYYDILEALQDPEHPGHANYREWMPDDFDPAKFDLDRASTRLYSLAGPGETDVQAFLERMDDRYPEPVHGLMKLGDPGENMPDYARMGFSAEHVPALIQMATDTELHFESPDEDAVWGPVHAWRTLGFLAATEAIDPLTRFLRENAVDADGYIPTEIPLALSQLGPPALPSLYDILRGGPYPPESQLGAIMGMSLLAEIFPRECRTGCCGLLQQQLEQFDENDPGTNAALISQLRRLRATEAEPIIARAMAAGAVDEEALDTYKDIVGSSADPGDSAPPAKPKPAKKSAKKKKKYPCP
jgi:hypothetical protein